MVIVIELERMKSAAASRERGQVEEETFVLLTDPKASFLLQRPFVMKNHFFLLFGFFTSFFAPCREAAMPITSSLPGSLLIPATAIFYLTSPSSAGLP